MLRIRLLNVVLLILAVLLLANNPPVSANGDARFLKLNSTDHYHYLDTSELKQLNPSPESTPIYHVWIKTGYAPPELDQLIKDRHTSCLPTAGYDCLSYSREHYLFNPAKMEIQSIETYHYGEADALLDHVVTPLFALKWHAIVPDTEQSLLFQQVSDYIAQEFK